MLPQFRDAHAPQPQPCPGQPRGTAAAYLEHLAARGVARARKAARAEADDRADSVGGSELDQLPLHAQLAEEDDPPCPAAAERRQGITRPSVRLRVRARVERKAEPVDPETARALRRRRERS